MISPSPQFTTGRARGVKQPMRLALSACALVCALILGMSAYGDDAGSAVPRIRLMPLTPREGAVEEPPPAPPAVKDASGENPLLDELERITFGASVSGMSLPDRLSALEQAVFRRVYSEVAIPGRLQRLSRTLFGRPYEEADSKKAQDQVELEKERPPEDLYRFAFQAINQRRQQEGAPPLAWNEEALKMAREHIIDITGRCVVSQFGKGGSNPDVRYTKLGGSDALTESVVEIPLTADIRSNQATMLKIIDAFAKRQDDRDAIFSPHATHFGFAYGTQADGQRLIACAETIIKHSIMHPIPRQVQVGEKIEIRGVMMEPYRFERISIAWEGASPPPPDAEDQGAYFPPLDYVAYGRKSEHGDHDKAMMILRTAGVAVAIAGGFFVPPVVLAAPLIAASGGFPGEPHAVSEIPVHGGIKIEGVSFHGAVPLSHRNQEGLYYVTVWASRGEGRYLIPVSRRVIVAKTTESALHISTNDVPVATEARRGMALPCPNSESKTPQ